MKKFKRTLSIFLTVMLIITLMPASVPWVHAADDDPVTVSASELLIDAADIGINAVTEIDLDNFDFGQPNGNVANPSGWSYNESTRVFTITGAGVTITGSTTLTGNVTFTVNSGVTVEYSGSITAGARTITISGGGTFNMTGGEITGTLPTSDGLITVSGAGTTIKIDNGTVSLTAGTTGFGGAMPVILLNTGAHATVTGGNITFGGTVHAEANAIRTAATGTGCVITISGGTINAGAGSAIQPTGGATLNVSGADTVIRGGNAAIRVQGSGPVNINISGGTISAPSMAVSIGSAGEHANCNITITGGTLSATAANGVAIATLAGGGGQHTVNITGGTITGGPSGANAAAINHGGSGTNHSFALNIIGGSITGAIPTHGTNNVTVRRGVSVTGGTVADTNTTPVTIGTTTHRVAAQAAEITINAGTPPSGQRFLNWTTTSAGVTLSSNTQAQGATFLMPTNVVAVTAVWETIPAPTAANFTHDLNTVRTFNGSQQGVIVTPQVGGAVGNVTATYYRGINGTNYNISPTAPTNAGTYEVTVNVAVGTDFAAANGVVIGNFTINRLALTGATINLAAGTFTYTGSAIQPGVTSVAVGSVSAVSADYTVGYSNNTNAGTATVTLTATASGNFSGSASTTFTIGRANQNALSITGLTGPFTYGDPPVQLTYGGGAVTYALSGAGPTSATVYVQADLDNSSSITLPNLPTGWTYGNVGTGDNTSGLIQDTPVLAERVLTFNYTSRSNNTTATIPITINGSNANYANSTFTVTVRADANVTVNNEITAAKLLIEMTSFTATQAQVTDSASAIARVQTIINGLNLLGVTAIVNTGGTFTAAVAGTAANPSGTNGSCTFTVALSKDPGAPQTTMTLTLTITATAHTSGGGGTGGGGAAPPPETPPAPPTAPTTPTTQPVTELPTASAAASAPTEAQTEAASEAVANAASSGQSNNISISQTGDPVSVSGGSSPTVTNVSGVDASGATVMAVVNEDGTLTPVPTKINPDGTVTVLVSGDVVLVPLNVEPDFNDVANTFWGAGDINKAASLMIIQGVGGGDFNPTGQVTNAEAVTMFLNALGIPADINADAVGGINQNAWYADAINTAAANGMITSGINPDQPMSRLQTAELIYNSLDALDMNPNMTLAQARDVLSGFTDLGHLSDTEMIQMGVLVELGIFQGNGDGTMTPDDVLQRVHMASLAVRVQELILG